MFSMIQALSTPGADLRMRDAAAVAEDRDFVGDFEDVVEKMRDEDEAAPALAHPAQHREQPRDLRRRQRRGRLVENDDARAGEQHARKLDELLHADRKIAETRARVDVEAEVLQLLRAPRAPCARQAIAPKRLAGCAPRNTFSATLRSGATLSS